MPFDLAALHCVLSDGRASGSLRRRLGGGDRPTADGGNGVRLDRA